MTDEDLNNLVQLLKQADPSAAIQMPGAVCSAGELWNVLSQAQTYRRLLQLANHRSAP